MALPTQYRVEHYPWMSEILNCYLTELLNPALHGKYVAEFTARFAAIVWHPCKGLTPSAAVVVNSWE